MTEAELVKKLQSRDNSAIEYLQRHYGPLMRYIIAPILPDPRDREEVFSDVVLTIWEKCGSFDAEKGHFTAWISALTRNAAIDRARKRRVPEGELTDNIPAPNSDPEQALLKKMRDAALLRALNELPYDEKLLFYRKYYYRQSTAQIAGELGTSERAIEGRLYRIKKKLRCSLGGEDFD